MTVSVLLSCFFGLLVFVGGWSAKASSSVHPIVVDLGDARPGQSLWLCAGRYVLESPRPLRVDTLGALPLPPAPLPAGGLVSDFDLCSLREDEHSSILVPTWVASVVCSRELRVKSIKFDVPSSLNSVDLPKLRSFVSSKRILFPDSVRFVNFCHNALSFRFSFFPGCFLDSVSLDGQNLSLNVGDTLISFSGALGEHPCLLQLTPFSGRLFSFEIGGTLDRFSVSLFLSLSPSLYRASCAHSLESLPRDPPLDTLVELKTRLSDWVGRGEYVFAPVLVASLARLYVERSGTLFFHGYPHSLFRLFVVPNNVLDVVSILFPDFVLECGLLITYGLEFEEPSQVRSFPLGFCCLPCLTRPVVLPASLKKLDVAGDAKFPAGISFAAVGSLDDISFCGVPLNITRRIILAYSPASGASGPPVIFSREVGETGPIKVSKGVVPESALPLKFSPARHLFFRDLLPDLHGYAPFEALPEGFDFFQLGE
jgi:hypothetical protein